MIALLSFALATVFDIRDYGAVADGSVLSTASIQRAIDDASATGHGVVVIPTGRFLTGSLHLRSHVELRLAAGTTLLGSSKRKDYDLGLWYSLLIAQNIEDVAITGKGTIDGQGKELAQDVLRMVGTGEVEVPPKGWRPNATDRPQIIDFESCHNIRIEDVTIKNSSCWVQTYRKCSNLSVTGIHVDSKTYWNNDGLDIVDCRGVHVANCDIDSDDDGICLKSEDAKSVCQNVLIENCRVRSSASAIKFGTGSYGGFRHIVVRGIQIRDTYRSAVALESVDGGILEDVLVENIKAVNTGNAFFIRLGHRNLRSLPGKVRRLVLRDIDVQVPTGHPDAGYPFPGPLFFEPHNLVPSSIVGHRDSPIEDVVLERIKIRFGGGGSKSVAYRPFDKVPERPRDYPDFTMFGELPAWAVYVRHVKNLQIRDLSVTLDAPDYRPAFVVDDVDRLEFESLKVSGDANPTALVRSGQHISLPPNLQSKPKN